MSELPDSLASANHVRHVSWHGLNSAARPALLVARIHSWVVRNFAKVVGLLIVAFLLQVLLAMRGTSPTGPEDMHITAGYAYWRFGNGKINYEQPPLVKILAAAPLLFLNPPINEPPPSERQSDFSPLAADFFAQNVARLDVMLFLARLPTAILASTLGLVIFAWSREIFGLGAGFTALLLYAFEPNFLGHSGIVFMDVPLAAISFFSLYALWKWCQRPSIAGVFISGIALGLALLTKFPALALVPVFVLLVGLEFMRGPRSWRTAFTHARGLAGIFLVAVMVVLLVYGAFFGAESLIKPGRSNYALSVLLGLVDRLPGGVTQPAEAAVRYLAERIPIVGLDFFRGLSFQREHLERGMPSFLLGQYSSHGWWYFHFVAFGLKTTTPMLVMIGLRILLLRRLPWHPAESFLAVPAVATLALSMASPHGSGLRYILPAYPFLIMLVGRLGAVKFQRQRLWVGLLSVLLIWHVVSSLRVYPYYLAFFNELAGGPSQGYRYLVASNLDFGQDLKRLAGYLQRRGHSTVYLSAHTAIDPALYGIRSLPLPADGRCRTGTIAISATHLQGVPFENKQAFVWLKERNPSAIVGHSIFVYDVDACPGD